MSKLELTKTQIDNIENKSMLVLPIEVKSIEIGIPTIVHPNYSNGFDDYDRFDSVEYFVKEYSQIQKGDKDVWIAEDVVWYDCKECGFTHGTDEYKCHKCGSNEYNRHIKINASKMTKEQSRYTISEILDVRVVKVQDIDIDDGFKLNINCPCESEILNHCNQILKEHNIDRTYEDNDYVFLVEYKY